MTRTVADYLIDIMLEAGVQHVYGVVGDSANPVADAIRRPTASSASSTFATRRLAHSPRVPTPRSPAVRRPSWVPRARAASTSSTGCTTATATARRCSRS